VELANNTTYGLGAAVFSSDLDKARSVADRLEAGMVFVNQPTGSSPELPFGGVKRSGYGRELSELGMFEFANRKLTRVLPAKKADKPQAG
jgi:succinate-semialdehyde dehydrogenase/glutarate-semialdehyde dehydrogenase